MSWDIEDETSPPPALPAPKPSTLGRMLPHSTEAEEYLISSCLIDGADVLARCHEMRIAPADFYEPKHAVVFDCISDVYKRKLPVDISVVAEELKRTRQFDYVGGYGFLTQVSSRIPTTAQASYFIDKVKEQSLLREIIRSATGAVEACYGFSGDIDQFVGDVKDRIERATEGASGALAQLKACEFNPNEKITDARVAFRLGNIPINTAGNIGVLVARAGVGKSAVVGAMIAAAMSKPTDDVDCLAFEGPNYEALPLLHFDTEQSKADYQKLLHRSLRRARREKFPDWFHSYHLTGRTAEDCRHLVETAISHFARKYNGRLFGVIIDGWADLVTNPNDEGECFPFIARTHLLAIKHDCPILGVLHLNPGSDAKSRGHLGSQLERKAETVLQLEMDSDDVTAIWATKKRGAPIKKDDGPRFKWSEDAGMHATVGDWMEQAAQRRADRAEKKKAIRPTTFSEQYSREEQVSFYPASNEKPTVRAVVFKRAHDASKISDRTLDRMRLQFLKDNWIEEVNGQFRRTREGDDWAKRKPGAKVVPFAVPPQRVEQQEVEL
jgi:hypothetical protein